MSISSRFFNSLAYNSSQYFLMFFFFFLNFCSIYYVSSFISYVFGSHLFSSFLCFLLAWLSVCQFLLSKTSSWFYWSFLLFFQSLFYSFPLWSLLFSSFCWIWFLFVHFLILIGGRIWLCVCVCGFNLLRKACITMNVPLRTVF